MQVTCVKFITLFSLSSSSSAAPLIQANSCLGVGWDRSKYRRARRKGDTEASYADLMCWTVWADADDLPSRPARSESKLTMTPFNSHPVSQPAKPINVIKLMWFTAYMLAANGIIMLMMLPSHGAPTKGSAASTRPNSAYSTTEIQSFLWYYCCCVNINRAADYYAGCMFSREHSTALLCSSSLDGILSDTSISISRVSIFRGIGRVQ